MLIPSHTEQQKMRHQDQHRPDQLQGLLMDCFLPEYRSKRKVKNEQKDY